MISSESLSESRGVPLRELFPHVPIRSRTPLFSFLVPPGRFCLRESRRFRSTTERGRESSAVAAPGRKESE